jgi:hypothetical protein
MIKTSVTFCTYRQHFRCSVQKTVVSVPRAAVVGPHFQLQKRKNILVSHIYLHERKIYMITQSAKIIKDMVIHISTGSIVLDVYALASSVTNMCVGFCLFVSFFLSFFLSSG